MLQPHEIYLSLGATPSVRQSACRELFRQALDPALVRDMRATVQTGTPLGNDRFRRQIEQTLQRSVGQPRRGRLLEKGY
jgi:putative transposase